MGDMAADFRALREMRSTVKLEQLDMHTKRLRWMAAQRMVHLKWMSSFHVRIWKASDARVHMDFWPSTGRGRGRCSQGTRAKTDGWAELMAALDIPDPFAEPTP
jgi:hypothetical protein